MMKFSAIKWISILLLVSAIIFPVVTSSYAQSLNQSVDSEESKEMNCCDKMEMMQKEMKSMMDHHKKMKNDMSSLFNELQQTGELTQEQIKRMQKIEQMMNKMEEKMNQMSTMGTDDLK